MYNLPILTILILLPIIGIFFIIIIPEPTNNNKGQNNVFLVSIWVAIVTFFISLTLLYNFNYKTSNFQFVEELSWISVQKIIHFNLKYKLGIDGLSILFINLTTFLIPICLIISKSHIQHNYKLYTICFLLLESCIIGTFSALDLVLFYLFFEIMLVPMFFIIGMWGGENRIYAAYKFFLYTLFGSLFFLTAIIFIIIKTGITDITILIEQGSSLFSPLAQKILWLAFFIAFAIKIPMWPVHTWLPDAHVQAPTAGSVLLAGVLIKIGAYGLIRLNLPIFPEATQYFSNWVLILSVIAIIYTSIIAFTQTDIKKLIAYSSIAHMGYVTIGIFSLNKQGLDGAIFQMIAHGIVSGALFLSIGLIYNRLHTRQISNLGGIATKMPLFATCFLIFSMASIALPGTIGFVGEFLILVGSFKVNYIVATFAATAVVLGAGYMLLLYKNAILGPITNTDINTIKQLSITEAIILIMFVSIIIILGIYPNFILNVISETVNSLIQTSSSL